MTHAAARRGSTGPSRVEVWIHKQAAAVDPRAPALFAMVRNEMYFLPHLLRHYRALGIAQFWFLDDGSDDGTFDFLNAQADCAVLQANRRFGDQIEGRRFGMVAKETVPGALLAGRWVLTVDADEFLLLPPGIADVPALCDRLERAGLPAARALMLDFFPPTLQALEDAAPDADPFAICPWFDALSVVDWPDGAGEPASISLPEGVRPRMLQRLLALRPDLPRILPRYHYAAISKVPLLHRTPHAKVLSDHRVNVPVPDCAQLVLAHFKFYPGYRARIDAALASKAHWRASVEYRFLDMACRDLVQWPLAGPRSRRFNSAADLVDAGLLFDRIGDRATSSPDTA